MRKLCCFVLSTAIILGLSPALAAQDQGESMDNIIVVDEETIGEECVILATEANGATEPKNPYKKADGWWDQGNIGGCVWTSLVNSNIQAGADDKGGKFARRFRRCLARKGLPNAWRRGVVIPSDNYTKMLACKKEARATESVEVEFKTLAGESTWDQKKQALADALAHGGAALIQTEKGTDRHSSSVISVDCTNNTMEIRDPNGGTYKLTFDANGKVTAVTPTGTPPAPGNSHYLGSTIITVTVECKTA